MRVSGVSPSTGRPLVSGSATPSTLEKDSSVEKGAAVESAASQSLSQSQQIAALAASPRLRLLRACVLGDGDAMLQLMDEESALENQDYLLTCKAHVRQHAVAVQQTLDFVLRDVSTERRRSEAKQAVSADDLETVVQVWRAEKERCLGE